MTGQSTEIELAAARRPLQVFLGKWVRNLGRIEAWSFVFHLEQNLFRCHLVSDPHALGRVASVAVLDGVDAGLFQGQYLGLAILVFGKLDLLDGQVVAAEQLAVAQLIDVGKKDA